ncbi:hypothetical protein [Pseudonocardia sp. HH130630-07]|uniref:hypothetical protein n=1 Tax=Pseudonocardia sp. HH130630-07 TaxID=1690815 RepID=UPI000814C707|nr:hypothetical protein [Pseudonocardia sp. HH130630-07]ANY10106.1 hypothetical protein AFB00_15905 [Pseudonocardia sp. HH130630-07]
MPLTVPVPSVDTAQQTLFVTTHVHTDGPIPGPHSLLTLTASAYRADGVPIGTFTANLRELPGATLHPTALETWRDRADDWLWTRRAARPPAQVVNAFLSWVEDLGRSPVFVTDPEQPDHLFCYWYLQRFAGRWPFAGITPAIDGPDRALSPPACPLSGCRPADGSARPVLVAPAA